MNFWYFPQFGLLSQTFFRSEHTSNHRHPGGPSKIAEGSSRKLFHVINTTRRNNSSDDVDVFGWHYTRLLATTTYSSSSRIATKYSQHRPTGKRGIFHTEHQKLCTRAADDIDVNEPLRVEEQHRSSSSSSGATNCNDDPTGRPRASGGW